MYGYGVSPLETMAKEAMLQGLCFMSSFTYSAKWETGTATALGAASTVEVDVMITGDADFLLTEINFIAYTAVATILANPAYLLTLITAGSGRQMMNQAQQINNMCGSYRDGCVPAHLPMPMLIQANNQLACVLQNLSAVANHRADLMLRGSKIFYTTNQQGQSGDRISIFHVL